jgi:hypothetical protein
MRVDRAILAGMGFGIVAFGAPATNDEANPLVMSPYEVSANSVDFQHWIKIGSPNYTLYTDASLKEATRILREAEMLRFAAQQLFRRQATRLARLSSFFPPRGRIGKKSKAKAESNGGWPSAPRMPVS